MRETTTLKLTAAAKAACARFWVLRVILIVVGGVLLGQYISSKLNPHPVSQMQQSVKEIEMNTDEINRRIDGIEGMLKDQNRDINKIKEEHETMMSGSSRQQRR